MNEKEEKILAAAFSLFSRFGLRKTTVDDIAREAHIGKGTVYLYFTSKEEIFLAVQRRHIKTFLQKLRSAIRGEASADKQLRKYLLTRFSLIEEHAKSRPFDVDLFIEAHSQPEYRIVGEEFEREEETLLRGILEMGVESGEFRAGDIDATIWVLRQAVTGMTTHLLIRKSITRVQDRVDDLLAVLLGGIRAREK